MCRRMHFSNPLPSESSMCMCIEHVHVHPASSMCMHAEFSVARARRPALHACGLHGGVHPCDRLSQATCMCMQAKLSPAWAASASCMAGPAAAAAAHAMPSSMCLTCSTAASCGPEREARPTSPRTTARGHSRRVRSCQTAAGSWSRPMQSGLAPWRAQLPAR